MLRLIFTISIADVAGPYANGDFTFFVEIPKTYPFHGTSVIHLLFPPDSFGWLGCVNLQTHLMEFM